MDNLAHTLSGLLLRRAGLGRDVPWSGPVLALAANLPDAEGVVVGWMDRPGYLAHHRGITHSFAGMLPESLLFAAAVWALGRWTSRRFPARLPRPPAFRPLLGLTLAGVAAHVLLDALNTYGLRLFLPFDGAWIYGDLAFIIDPWMWLLLGGGGLLAGPTSRAAAFVWAALAAAASFLTIWSARAGIVPAGVPVVWFAGLAALAGAALLRRGRPPSPVPARAAAAAYVLYLAALFAMGREARAEALEEHRRSTSHRPAVVGINPRPGVPWDFLITLWNEREVHRYRASAFGGTPRALPVIETGLDDPAIDLFRDRAEVRSWRIFARQPIARREGGSLVLGDARYRSEERGDWTEMALPLPSLPPPRRR